MGKIGNFFHTVFVKAVWQTFFVKWVWETFFVAWIYKAFWKNFVVKKLRFDKWKGWVYLAPALVLLALFTFWPIFNTVRMAFSNGYNSVLENAGVKFEFGVQNFINVIQVEEFTTALKNTMLLCVLTVPLSTLLALLIAVALNSIKPLQKFLQTIFFLPYVTNSIAIGMVFMAMFNMTGTGFDKNVPNISSYGIINTIIGWFGGDPINWVNSNSSYENNLAVLVIYIIP